MLFVFQFYPVYNFGKLINFELGIVGSERVKGITNIWKMKEFKFFGIKAQPLRQSNASRVHERENGVEMLCLPDSSCKGIVLLGRQMRTYFSQQHCRLH